MVLADRRGNRNRHDCREYLSNGDGMMPEWFLRIERWTQVLILVGALFGFALHQESRLSKIEQWELSYDANNSELILHLNRMEARIDAAINTRMAK